MSAIGLKVLRIIYSQTKGNPNQVIYGAILPTTFDDVATTSGIRGEGGRELLTILEQLSEDGYIKIDNSIYGLGLAPIGITKSGILKVESLR